MFSLRLLASRAALFVAALLLAVPFTAVTEAPQLANWQTPQVPPPSSSAVSTPEVGYPPNTVAFPTRERHAQLITAPDVPDDPRVLAVLSDSQPLSASSGVTIIAGHIRTGVQSGFLQLLHEIGPNELLLITDYSGVTTRWRAVARQTYIKNRPPEYPSTGPHRIVIVTCTGPLQANGRFRDNLAVTFEQFDTPQETTDSSRSRVALVQTD